MNASSGVGARLHAIDERIGAACGRAGRSRSEVVLIGASKKQPLMSLRQAWDAGLRTFGENRVQEAEEKAPRLDPGIDWHLLGPLQSNKARRAVELFSTIHSLDRPKIVRVVDRLAGELELPRSGFLEVNLGGEASKHGFAPSELVQAVASLGELTALKIVGLMAIPPLGESPEDTRAWFRRLRALRDDVSREAPPAGWAGCLSMGMSADFEIAVEEGATHVRVGTNLFGPRPAAGAGTP